MKTAGILFCIVLLFSCARKYSISSVFRKGVPADMQQLVLDSSYHLYIREVFLDDARPGDKLVKISNENFRATDKLIEIEYLLFSAENMRAVYISTIPDKYQVYYAKKGRYLKREYLNAYDFSTFRFGKKQEHRNEIVFENNNTRHSDTWKFNIEQDSVLHVYEVVERINDDETNVYLVDEALSRKATFFRTDSFRIVFRNMDKEKKVEIKRGRPPLQRFWKDSIIYFRNENNRYAVYFRFNKSLPPGYRDSTISFNHARLVNIPFE
jgi:hypothetical protein